MSGFVTLHREALDHHLFRGDSARLGAWFWLIGKACWKPTTHDARGRTITVERGQLCAGREYLAKEWGWSPSAVERFLVRLETEHMIERQTGQGKSVITICNYDKYQDVAAEDGHMSGQSTEQKSDRNRTAKEQGNKETREPNGSHTPHIPPADFFADAAPPAVPDPAQPVKRKRQAGAAPYERPADVSEQTWADFLAMRNRKRAPVSETVIVGFRREADRVGWSLEQAISESVLRDWRGFKADWVRNNDRSNGPRNDRRYEPEGGIAEGLRRIGIAGDQGAPREVGRWDDGGFERGYHRTNP
ncbi:UNVERIFIED_ORG: hypothetical protein M2348_001311 [Sphingomonas sp. R1F5B]